MLSAIGKRYGFWKFNTEMRLRRRGWLLRHGLARFLYKLSLRIRHLAAMVDATAITEAAVKERHPYRSTSGRYRWH